MSDTPVTKVVRSYYVWVGSFLLLIHFGLWWQLHRQDRRPLASGSPFQKAEYYRRHADRFDLVFLGDSRTYCGLHPSDIDPLLGTRSYNLSMFAHWLPTQYPAIQDLVADIPPGTTVVWSIGSGNLAPVGADRKVRDAYPIGLANVPRYSKWGYRWSDVNENVVRFATNNWPSRLLAKFTAWTQTPTRRVSKDGGKFGLESPSRTQPSSSLLTRRVGVENASNAVDAELDDLLRKFRADASVSTLEILRDSVSNNVTSLAVVSLDGAYRRHELDRPYFRRQQAAHAAELRDQVASSNGVTSYEPDAAYWQTFLAILELFRQREVRVIVNEIPEAPYVYRHSVAKRAEREFLRREVRREVEAHGFTWVSPDTSVLQDEDYFDYNHLNSQGVARYSALMADALRPHVQKAER